MVHDIRLVSFVHHRIGIRIKVYFIGEKNDGEKTKDGYKDGPN
jgi:hypothetical protein